MKEAVACRSEAEFRAWFDQNFAQFGIKRIILSQEPCPDYIVEMNDGTITKVEAELFAINFRYHGHDPKKVDFIVACYSKTEEVDGVKVMAVNKLWCWDVAPEEPVPSDAPLSKEEASLLHSIHISGGISVMAFSEGSLKGDQQLWIRFSPETISKFPRGKLEDSLFGVMSPANKKWLKEHHHVMVGAGLSEEGCRLINSLMRRDLIRYRPLDFMSAMYDGPIVDHPGWLPTELKTTANAEQFHGDLLRKFFFKWDEK